MSADPLGFDDPLGFEDPLGFKEEESTLDKIKRTAAGIGDAALTIGSGAAWGIGAPIEAALKKGAGMVPDFEAEANRIAQEKSRQPQTEMGADITHGVGDFMNRYLLPVAPMIIGPIAGTLKGKMRKGPKEEAAKSKFDSLERVEPTLPKEADPLGFNETIAVTPEGQGILPGDAVWKARAEEMAAKAKQGEVEFKPGPTPFEPKIPSNLERLRDYREAGMEYPMDRAALEAEMNGMKPREALKADDALMTAREEANGPTLVPEHLGSERLAGPMGSPEVSLRRGQGGAIDVQAITEGLNDLKNRVITSVEALSKWRGAFDPNELKRAIDDSRDLKSRERLMWISPDDFHKLAAPRTGEPTSTSGDVRRMSIREGLGSERGLNELPMLLLNEEGKVIQHNGRHRMDVFKELGIERVPVRIRDALHRNEKGPLPYRGLLSEDRKSYVSANALENVFPQRASKDLSSKFSDLQVAGPLPTFKRNQAGMLNIGDAVDKVSNVFKRTKPLPVTSAELMAKRPGMGKDLDGAIPRGPKADSLIELAKQEQDGKPLWQNMKSGLTLTADQVKSSLMLGVARWFQYGEKRGEFDYRREVQPLEKTLQGFKTDELVLIEEALRRQQLNGREYSPQELSSVGLSKRGIEAIQAFKKAYDRTFEGQNKMLEALGKKPMTKEDFYYSSVWHGDWHVPVKDAKGNLVWYIQTMSRSEANKALKYLGENFPELQVDGLKPEHRPNTIDPNVPRDVISAYHDMQQFFTDNAEMSANIKAAMEAYAQEKGFGAFGQDVHFLQKKGVRGFEGDRPWLSEKKNAHQGLAAQLQYLRNAYRWMPMQEALAEVKKIMSDPDLVANQPNNMDLVRQYVAQQIGMSPNVFRPMEQSFAKAIGNSRSNLYLETNTMKSLFYLQTLGANMGYMVATPLQGLISVPAWHLKTSGEGFRLNPAKALSAYSKGISDATSIFGQHYFNTWQEWAGKKSSEFPMTKLGREAMKYAEDNGIISKNLFDETSGLGENTAITGLKNTLGGTISMPEKLVRTFSFMSFAHHLDATGKFKDRTSMFQRAEELTNNALTDFRKSERPLVVDKLGIPGQVAYTFHSFLFNMFNQMKGFLDQKNYVALSSFLGSLVLLGGVMDLPFMNELDGMWNIMKDFTAEYLPQHYKKVSGPGLKGTVISKLPEALAWGHASTALGWQMASRFSPNLIDPENPMQSVFPMAKSIENLNPLPLAAGNKTAATQYAYDNSPAMVKGLMENNMDVFKTPKGGIAKPTDLQAWEKRYQRDDQDRAARNLGVTSLKEADYKVRDYINRSEEKRVQTARKENLNHLWDSIHRKNPEDIKTYAKAYFQLGGSEDTLNSFLSMKAEKLGLTPKQFMEAHMSSLARVLDVKRRLDMDKKE